MHGNGLESVLERCREAIEPHRVFAASLRAVLERSWSGLGAILDRSGTGLGPVWDRVKKHAKSAKNEHVRSDHKEYLCPFMSSTPVFGRRGGGGGGAFFRAVCAERREVLSSVFCLLSFVFNKTPPPGEINTPNAETCIVII